MSASPWRSIPARNITVGDIVSVRGITNRASAIVHVAAVSSDRDRIVVAGRQPWGDGWRVVERTLHPEGVAELLVEDAEGES